MKCRVFTFVIAILMAIAGAFRASATPQAVDYLFIGGEVLFMKENIKRVLTSQFFYDIINRNKTKMYDYVLL